MENSTKPLFESHALTTLDRAKETFAGRGTEYGDTWRETRFLNMQAVAKTLGCDIKPEHFRALASAAFVDMKYWRMLGGYKDDSLIDGINYQAFLAEEMRAIGGKPEQAAEPEWPKYWLRSGDGELGRVFRADNSKCRGFYWQGDVWVRLDLNQPFCGYETTLPYLYSPITSEQAKQLGARVD